MVVDISGFDALGQWLMEHASTVLAAALTVGQGWLGWMRGRRMMRELSETGWSVTYGKLHVRRKSRRLRVKD